MTQELKPMAPHNKILLGLFVGTSLGLLANLGAGDQNTYVEWFISNIAEPVGLLFLRPLLMTVIPLVFTSLIIGIAGMGEVGKLKRVAVRCILYTVVISAISVVIGLGLANTIKPGTRVSPETAARLQEKYSQKATKEVEKAKKPESTEAPLTQAVKALIPSNPMFAISGETPNMLQLMIFSLFLGVALALLPQEKAAPLLSVLDSLYSASAKIIELVMKLAPYAIACLLFTSVARFGLELLQALFWFIVAVLAGLSLHMFVVYSLSLRFLSKVSPREFFRRIETVMLTAFATSSSNATLPTAMKASEEELLVPKEIGNFVLTVGATANQNGTALFEGVTVLFLAQLAGVELSLGQQIMVAYLAILGGIGTAGVPSGSIPFIIVVLASIGVNPALIAIVLGVDRLLDMCRTVVNVVGDLTIATYVARTEGAPLFSAKSWSSPQPSLPHK
jgi:dicarboxylate/amino acid:cation (Na+ or H+) symporter, DAACS family